MKNVYSFLIEKTTLSEKHQQELINKRGLSDATIREFKFRSAGPELMQMEGLLRNSFVEAELVQSGVFIKNPKDPNAPAVISSQLLTEGILIPYLDLDGGCYHLRVHKLGFASIPIEIFSRHVMKDRPLKVVLTEGEFKAVAGTQLGVVTISVPGIGSFSDQHFNKLTAFLNEFGTKEVCVIFDNEVKDDPAFPKRYKENNLSRYDTQYYSFYMAQRLEKEGFVATVGWLPDSWRVDGKIDIDGATAQGKDTGDYKKIIFAAKTPNDYLDTLPTEARHVVRRKLNQKYHKCNIRKEFNRYIVTRQRGKSTSDEPISNFTIRILATHETPEGISRDICFADEHGVLSPSFRIDAEDMIRNDNFATFCASKGDYIWKGTPDEVKTLWESEFLMMDEGRRIIEPDHIGYVHAEKSWLFGNVAFLGKEMKEVRPDKNQTYWMEKRGLRPTPLSVAMGKNMVSEGVPYLSTKEIDVKVILEKFCTTIGEKEAKICLGWISAVIFMEEVFEKYDCFPFLFVTGRRGSGKSTVAEWLMNFFGMEHSGKMMSETTSVAIQRYLSYYSSLPFFLDEYRNTEQIKWKTGLLRNAYNRQSAGKGTKEGFGVREAKVRGTLLLSGEETPEDSALLSRCVPVFITEKSRVENHYEWFQKNKVLFSYHILWLLRNKNALLPKFWEVFNEARAERISEDERTLINYAVISAGYAVAFGDKDLSFGRHIVAEAQRVFAEVNDEQPVSLFFDGLMALKTRKIVDDRYWDVTSDGRLMIYFEGLYIEWSKDYRQTRGVVPFKKSAIRSYLKEEAGFVHTCVNHSLKGQVRSCVEFKADTAPDMIKNLVGLNDTPYAGEEEPRSVYGGV